MYRDSLARDITLTGWLRSGLTPERKIQIPYHLLPTFQKPKSELVWHNYRKQAKGNRKMAKSGSQIWLEAFRAGSHIVLSEVCKFPREKLMPFTSARSLGAQWSCLKIPVHRVAVAASPILAAAPSLPPHMHIHTHTYTRKPASSPSKASLMPTAQIYWKKPLSFHAAQL